MRIDLGHVASRVFGTPLLIQEGKLGTILSAVGPRILDGSSMGRSIESTAIAAALAKAAAPVPAGQGFAGGGYYAGGGIGVLPIIGTLVRRGSYLDAESGLASYATIGAGFDQMIASANVRGILLEIDSPGGEVGGCFDLARHIRQVAAAAGKPVWAHVNELAASAGYALASAAERIWIPTTGEVGSIGVYAAHLDVSAAESKAGVRWTLISAGDHKVDGNTHEPLSDRARAAIQADVGSLYTMFVDLVAEHRPKLSAARVRATKADVYRGVLALEASLADEVGTFEQSIEAFGAHLGGASGPLAPGRSASRPTARVAASESTAAVTGERDRAKMLHGLGVMAARIGVDFDVEAAIAGGVTIDAARTAVMNTAAERDEASDTAAHVWPTREATEEKRGMSAEAKRTAWRKVLRNGQPLRE